MCVYLCIERERERERTHFWHVTPAIPSYSASTGLQFGRQSSVGLARYLQSTQNNGSSSQREADSDKILVSLEDQVESRRVEIEMITDSFLCSCRHFQLQFLTVASIR